MLSPPNRDTQAVKAAPAQLRSEVRRSADL